MASAIGAAPADAATESLLDNLVTGQLADAQLLTLPLIAEYRLRQRLGQGAMGCVYLAHDTLLDRPVALKFLSGPARSEAARQRFLVEARAVARLQHPNVVTVFRIGEVARHPFLASEYVRGQSLDRLQLPLPGAQLLHIAVSLTRGLAAAHRRGVLHRDIKPANAILAEDGSVKLLDFGLAKLSHPVQPISVPALALPAHPQAIIATQAPSEEVAALGASADEAEAPLAATQAHGPVSFSLATTGVDSESAELTRAGASLGTPLYMAPEMWRSEPATVSVDLYSLGAVLYELASGHPPLWAETLAELRHLVLIEQQQPVPLRERAPQVEPELAAIIDRCLRPLPAERFASAEALCQALEQLQLQGSAHNKAPPGSHVGNPYRGLRAFDTDDSPLFYGRAAERAEILARLHESPIVLVTGDSGVGKSSLCRAGVLARVLDGAMEDGRTYAAVLILPGKCPALAVADALAPVLGVELAALHRELLHQPDEAARRLQRYPSATRGLFLFIDQLEELITHSLPEEAQATSELLAQLAARVAGLRVLLTARGDFLTRLAALPGLGAELGRSLYILRPLGPDGLRQAIVGPAEAHRVRFESAELVEELVQSTLQAEGGLPLLQFALAELWDARDQKAGLITRAALRDKGGVGGALSRHADRAIAELLPAERSAAQRLLVRLVTSDGVRARRARSELVGPDPADGAALEALVKSRLLVARESAGDTVYEVAHEALLSGWPQLRKWLDSAVARQAVEERLATAAAEWERLLEHPEALWSERQLNELERVGLQPSELVASELRFLTASRKQLRRLRWGRWALYAGVLVTLLFSLLAIWRSQEQHEREGNERSQRERSERMALGARALGLADLPGHEGAALAAAVQAVAAPLRDGVTAEPEALMGLSAAVQVGRQSIPLYGHRAAITAAMFSPDPKGQLALTASRDGTARLWEGFSGAPLRALGTSGPALVAAEFSADGQLIATLDITGCAAIWETATGELRHRVQACKDCRGAEVRFSPDGSRLLVQGIATGAHAPTLLSLWDPRSGQRIAELAGSTAVREGWPFSADGRLLAVADPSGTVRLHATRDGQLVHTLSAAPSQAPTTAAPMTAGFTRDGKELMAQVATGEQLMFWELPSYQVHTLTLYLDDRFMAAFLSPDGSQLLSRGMHGSLKLWQRGTGTLRAILGSPDSTLSSLGFSPDGRLIVTTGSEPLVRLWDTSTGQVQAVLRGHDFPINRAQFSPDGQRLLTASDDGTARLYDLHGGQHRLRLSGHDAAVNAATYSRDGRYVATASSDRSARVWNASSGAVLATLKHPDGVTAVAFAADSGLLATGTDSEDKTVRVWDFRKGRELAVLRQHEARILSVALSPDGERLASASQDTTVIVWDWRAGRAIWRSPEHVHRVPVQKVAFSPDGQRLATGDCGGAIRLFSATTGHLDAVTRRNQGRAAAAMFAPDGRYLAVAGRRTLILDTGTSDIARELVGHLDATIAVSYSLDGRRLATLGSDQTARVFDVASGQTVHLLRVGEATSIELSPDGQSLLVAHPADHSAKVYPASPQPLLTSACELLRHQPEDQQVLPLCAEVAAR